MNMVGHICPFGGTNLSQLWDTCGTPVLISYIFEPLAKLRNRADFSAFAAYFRGIRGHFSV
jgi:hypothetical protein